MSAIATVLANIEVIILVKAFGMEQTLGNVLFASTFLITDILSECEGRKEANKAVTMSIFVSVFFLLLSQSWLLYVPSAGDTMMPSIKAVFSNTPRMILASLVVYVVSQFLMCGFIISGGLSRRSGLATREDFCGCVTTAPRW